MGRIRTAKENKDAETDPSEDMTLDSDLLLPKIYAVKKLEPDYEAPSIAGPAEYSHGLGYAPMYMHYQEHEINSALGTRYSPKRWIWGPQNSPRGRYIDDTKFYSNSEKYDSYLTLFLDPLEEPATPPSPTTHDWGRVRIGDNVEEDADYKNRIDSKYQTLKVHMQGTVVGTVPQRTISAGTTEDDFLEVTHGLGYPAVFAPFGISAVGLSLNLYYDGELTDIPTSIDFNELNDVMVERWAYALTFATNYPEVLTLQIDSNKMYMRHRRQNVDFSGSVTFPARTFTLRYTIFNNRIDEEFDILTA